MGQAEFIAVPLKVKAFRPRALAKGVSEATYDRVMGAVTPDTRVLDLISNQDEFIHQIYVDSDKIDYDSAEQPPGQIITIPFPKSGDFPVRCHIHPKMLLTIHVK